MTSGTGSGKSLTYNVPAADYALKRHDQDDADRPHRVEVARYPGQEREDERARIRENPPDILLTNFVMLELLLTRPRSATRCCLPPRA